MIPNTILLKQTNNSKTRSVNYTGAIDEVTAQVEMSRPLYAF